MVGMVLDPNELIQYNREGVLGVTTVAHSSFGEAMLKVGLPGLGVSDLALEYIYDGLLRVIVDGTCVGGDVIKSQLLLHYREHAV